MRHPAQLVARLGGAALVLALASPAAAEKVLAHDDTVINLSALLQPQAVLAEGAAPDGGTGTDFFLRRARLMLHGDLNPRIAFFVDTEQVNLGKDGDWATSIYIQDAFVSLRATAGTAPGVYLDAGMLLVPFTRHAMQSAVSLNGLDYHGKLILYPSQSTRVWRDVGIQARANLGRLHLRAGLFNGVEGTPGDPEGGVMARNPGDVPRVAGHARYALVGEDQGFFYPGLPFTDAAVVSVGLGVDWQEDAIGVMTGPDDHLALAADVYAHVPTGADQAVVVQATVVRYDDGDGAATTGLGGFVEAGFRVGRVEPIVAYEHFDADAAAGDLRAVHLAGAYFVDQHRTNLKLDVGRTRAGVTDAAWTAALQAQLSF